MPTESFRSFNLKKYARLFNSREILLDSLMRSNGDCERRVGGKIQSVGKRQLAPESCRYFGDDSGASSETNNPEKKVASDRRSSTKISIGNPEVKHR